MICGLEDWPSTLPEVPEPRLARSLGVDTSEPCDVARAQGCPGRQVPHVALLSWLSPARAAHGFLQLQRAPLPGLSAPADPEPLRGVLPPWAHRGLPLLRVGARGRECAPGRSRAATRRERPHVRTLPTLWWSARADAPAAWPAPSTSLLCEAFDGARAPGPGSALPTRAVTRSCALCSAGRPTSGSRCSARRFRSRPSPTSPTPSSPSGCRTPTPTRAPRRSLRGFRPPEGCTQEDLVRAIHRWRNPAVTEAAPSDRELRAEEYTALVRGMGAIEATDQFLCEEVDIFGSGIPEIVAQVSRVSRLREVRALTGFTRVVPSTDENDVTVAPLSESAHPVWLSSDRSAGRGGLPPSRRAPLRVLGRNRLRPVEAAPAHAFAGERRGQLSARPDSTSRPVCSRSTRWLMSSSTRCP